MLTIYMVYTNKHCIYSIWEWNVIRNTANVVFLHFLIQNKSLPPKQVKVYIFGSFLVTSSMSYHASWNFFPF